MFIRHNGVMFRVVAERSYGVRLAHDKRLITSDRGVPWHVGATRVGGGSYEPIAWKAYPGHCEQCGPPQDASPEEIREAQAWAADCIGVTRLFADSGETISAERAVRYVQRHYPGGWDAFVTECCATL